MGRFTRFTAAFLLAVALALAPMGCARRAQDPGAPTASTTPRQRASVYNGVVLEANLALTKGVIQSAQTGGLSVHQTKTVLAWTEQVARSGQSLAMLLKQESIPLSSPEFATAVAAFAVPQAVSAIGNVDPQITASIAALSSAVALLQIELRGAK